MVQISALARPTRGMQRLGQAESQSLRDLLSAVPHLSRPVLAHLASSLIDRLDQIDGDPDLELNGDELDGSGMAEDEFVPHSNWRGEPGCPLSDPGEEDFLMGVAA